MITIVETSWGGEIEINGESGRISLKNCDKFYLIKENAGVPGLIGPDIEINIDEVVEDQIMVQKMMAS